MANRLQQTIQLQTKISPQQIQMIKLLELPAMQLEERIKREIEENIVLAILNIIHPQMYNFPSWNYDS